MCVTFELKRERRRMAAIVGTRVTLFFLLQSPSTDPQDTGALREL